MLPLEFVAAILAYWTMGWSSVHLLIGAAILFNSLAKFKFKFWSGVIVALLFGVFLVGSQSVLGIQWYRIDTEAHRIVEWVRSEEMKNGSAPNDLSAFEFKCSDCEDSISFEKWTDSEGKHWGLSYIVGSDSTYHSYDPVYGWVYHDD